jgi:hypothetical protein
MNKILSALALLTSVSSFAASNITAKCVQAKGYKNDTWLIGDEEKGAEFKLTLSKNSFKTDIQIYNGKVTGTFVKVTDQGSYMFSSFGLTEFADQSDNGYTFISKELMNGKNGKVTFSVRQLGDTEGSWWLNQHFNCKVK